MPKPNLSAKTSNRPQDPMELAANSLPGLSGNPVGLNSPATAGPAGGGSTSEEIVRRSNMWRDNYNPLRGLTIARLMALIEQAERGAFAEIQLTLRKAEKRFPVLKGFIEKLLSSIEELDGKVRVKEQLPEGGTPAMAEKQRKFLQGRYDLLKNFKTSIAQIALADLRGYAVLQKHRYHDGGPNDGAVEELYWLEPWCWVRDGFYGDFYYNRNSQFGIGLGSCQAALGEENRIGSEALPRGDFVIRESEAPLYEIALIAFVNWLMGRKDYAAFTEIFGLPNAIVIMPPNIPVGKEDEYLGAAEKTARGVSGALPNGSDVKFPTAGVKGESPFETFCSAQEKDFVLAGTGGHLTMLQAAHGGLGKGGAEEHDAAWQKIAVTKAVRINDALQRDFDAPELAAEFPGEPVCVEFRLDIEDSEDVGEFLDNVVKGVGLGFLADVAEVSERSGIKFERAPEPEPAAPGAPNPADPLAGAAAKADQSIDLKELKSAVRNRIVKILNRAGADDAEQFYAAIAHDLKPLRDRLAAIEQISDPDLQRQKLAALYADLDQLTRDLVADPETTRVLEAISANALMKGLSAEEKKSAKLKNRGRVLNGGGNPNHDGRGLFSAAPAEGGESAGVPKEIREQRVVMHPAAMRAMGLQSQHVYADHAAMAKKHPELFDNSQEAKEYIDHVAEHPTHVFPGNVPNHRLVVRREGDNKSIAVEVEKRGGKYRVCSAHTLTEDQFQAKLNAAGPGATLGVSRVHPKNRAPETPSRSLEADRSAPPAVIQRILHGLAIVK